MDAVCPPHYHHWKVFEQHLVIQILKEEVL